MTQYATAPKANSHPLDTDHLAPRITIQEKRKSQTNIFTKMTQVLLNKSRNNVDATRSGNSLATQVLVVNATNTRTAYLIKVTRE